MKSEETGQPHSSLRDGHHGYYLACAKHLIIKRVLGGLVVKLGDLYPKREKSYNCNKYIGIHAAVRSTSQSRAAVATNTSSPYFGPEKTS